VSEHRDCDVCELTYRDCHVCESTHRVSLHIKIAHAVPVSASICFHGFDAL
jgi:hypothetical protein